MFDRQHIVDPYARQVIDCTKMQDDAAWFFVTWFFLAQVFLARFFLRGIFFGWLLILELTLIPAGAMEAGVAYSARAAFGSKRHEYGMGPFRHLGRLPKALFRIENEFPFSIQRHPLRTFELGDEDKPYQPSQSPAGVPGFRTPDVIESRIIITI